MTICIKEKLLTPTDVRFVKLKRKHLHRDLLEARFRMDHKAYTSCTLSQYHGAIGYFGRKRRRNNGQGT